MEGAIQAAAPEESFGFGEVAVGIEFLCFGGDSCILEFFEVNNLAGEAREDVEEAGVFERIFREFLFHGSRGEVSEDFEALAGDNLEGGLWKGKVVAGANHFEGGFA